MLITDSVVVEATGTFTEQAALLAIVPLWFTDEDVHVYMYNVHCTKKTRLVPSRCDRGTCTCVTSLFSLILNSVL